MQSFKNIRTSASLTVFFPLTFQNKAVGLFSFHIYCREEQLEFLDIFMIHWVFFFLYSTQWWMSENIDLEWIPPPDQWSQSYKGCFKGRNDLRHAGWAVKMISISVPGPTGRKVHSLKRSWAWDGPGFNLPELVFTSAFLLLSTPGVLVQ